MELRTYVSTADGREVMAESRQSWSPAEGAPDEWTIVVDPTVQGQPIEGFGANFTDTDYYNLTRMSPAEQDRALEKLFDPERGAGWNMMRVPFGSTDWERNMDFYSYDDMPEGEKDPELAHFSIQKDIDRGYLRMLRRIRGKYPEVRYIASVWAVPGWMKNNDSLLGGIFLPEYTEIYARYLCMAVEAFAEEGIPLYALTIQNEPRSSDFPNNNRGTPATRFTWRLQRDVLIALRREFDRHGITTRIWAYDHNYDMTESFVDPLLADTEAFAAIDGVAFHPYRGDPAVLGKYTERYPELPLYSTEKTVCEPREMDELLRQLRYGARSYLMWNFLTDECGGPHQLAGNPFRYGKRNLRTTIWNDSGVPDDWHTTGYYGLFAQFTRFLRRGMRQIGCSYGHPEWVTAVAFREEDGPMAVVTVNQTAEEQVFTLRCGDRSTECRIPAQAVATMVSGITGDMESGYPRVDDAPEPPFAHVPAWDLSPTDLWFEEPCRAGEEIRFRVRITNVGDAPTPPNVTAVVDLLMDGDYRAARCYGTVPVLAPGESIVWKTNAPVYDASGTGCKTTWTALAGWHDFMAFMQAGNVPQQENPYNNRCCREYFFEA